MAANKQNFWVLETDYTGYAVIYGCLTAINQTTRFCPENEVNAWALARFVWEPPSDYAIRRIDHRLDYFCSNVSNYKMVVHNKERKMFTFKVLTAEQGNKCFSEAKIHNTATIYKMTHDETPKIFIGRYKPHNPDCFSNSSSYPRIFLVCILA